MEDFIKIILFIIAIGIIAIILGYYWSKYILHSHPYKESCDNWQSGESVEFCIETGLQFCKKDKGHECGMYGKVSNISKIRK
jgi:hypothetical protein